MEMFITLYKSLSFGDGLRLVIFILLYARADVSNVMSPMCLLAPSTSVDTGSLAYFSMPELEI